jgi:hypothetical protein
LTRYVVPIEETAIDDVSRDPRRLAGAELLVGAARPLAAPSKPRSWVAD